MSMVTFAPTRPPPLVADAVIDAFAVNVPVASGHGLIVVVTRTLPSTPFADVPTVQSSDADSNEPPRDTSLVLTPLSPFVDSGARTSPGLRSLVPDTSASGVIAVSIQPAKIIPPIEGVSSPAGRTPSLPR